MSTRVKPATAGKPIRAGFMLSAITTLLFATSGLLVITSVAPSSAMAAEQSDYEWDPSGIYTRTMRHNSTRSAAVAEDYEEPAAAASQPPSSAPARRAIKQKSTNRKARVPSPRKPKSKSNRTRVASLGRDTPVSLPQQSLSGGGGGKIVWQAPSKCLNGSLRNVIAAVAANYGRVRVNSTCRSKRHNRRVGGARRSYHLTGDAADIRIFGNWRRAAVYLRSAVGGYKHYGGGRFHIDTGPRRRF
ncbi:MAG: hypothetical protein RLZ98_226 [Pseudomonadota bacterium]